MAFSIDFLDDGRVLEWEATADGSVATEHEDYSPRFYVALATLTPISISRRSSRCTTSTRTSSRPK
jgi:hypothetical protein